MAVNMETATPMAIGTIVMPSARMSDPSLTICAAARAVSNNEGNAILTGMRPAYSHAASTMPNDATRRAAER